MKPLKLRVKNFGPYIDETIDFTRFEESSLFLISGKTGSGKTTIFDGMSYALFGESSGKLRQGKELRSTFADPSEATEVCLLFSHGNFLYEVTRKPEQELYKKRGDGTRVQPAKISLIVKNAAGKELKEYTKRREVDSFIQELLHLDAEQFSQIVLLPQGEFRTFLIANSSEKEKVLRRLFGTQMYQILGEELKQQSKQRNLEIDQIRQKIELKLEQLYWELEPEESLVEEKLILLGKQQEKNLGEQEKLLKELDLLKKVLQGKEQEKYKLEEQLKLTARYQTLKEKQEQLSAQKAEIECKRQREQNLLWLRTQEHLIEAIEELQKEVMEKQLKYTKGISEKRQAEEQLSYLMEQAASYEADKAEISEKELELTKLTMKLPLYEEKEQLEKKLSEATVDQLAVQLAEKQTELSEAEQRLEKLKEQQGLTPQLEKEQLILLQQEKEWSELLNNFLTLEEARQQVVKNACTLDELDRQTKQAEADRKVAEKHLESKEQDWLKRQIDYLRLQLKKGQACPVCGSLDHPKEAEPQEFSMADIQQAEDELNESEKQLKQLEAQATRLQTEYQTRKEQHTKLEQQTTEQQQVLIQRVKQQGVARTEASLGLAMEVFEEKLKEIRAALALTKDKLSTLQAAEKEQSSVLDLYNQLKQELTELETTHQEKLREQQLLEIKRTSIIEQLEEQLTFAECLAKERELKAELESWQQGLAENNQQLNKVKETIQRLTAEEHYLTQALEQTRRSLEGSENKLQDSIKTSGITLELNDFAELKKQLVELPALQQEIIQFENEHREIRAALKNTEDQLSKEELPSLSEVEQAIKEQQQQIQEKEGYYYQQKEKLDTNERIKKAIVASIASIDKKWTEAAAVQQLADTINGDNPRKTSLERYVLQTYLQEVLRTANIRMSMLTNSRYQFELNSEKNSYKSQTGLEINIYDDNAGVSRSARTLSGGESFIAALALALSLAEVIQEQSGGVLIEALFIDEGFGSLDEEALEMAIEALETIENEGRMIGIISHVAELKSRISQQLQIKTNGAGQSRVSYQTM